MDAGKSVILALAILVAAVVGLAVWFSQSNAPGGTSLRPEAPDPGDTRSPRPRPDRSPPPLPGPKRPRDGGITGVVTDDRGEPAESATVLLLTARPPAPAVPVAEKERSTRDRIADLFQYYPDETGPLHPIGTEPAWKQGREEPLATTLTDAQGRFAFPDVAFARYRVAAEMGDLAAPETAALPGKPVTLVLRPAARIKGWVRSAEDHRMLAGARIRVVQGGRVALTNTDGRGDYSISGLPSGPVMVFAWHPEYAGDLKKSVLLTAGGETEVDFDLSRGHSLTVTVYGLPEEGDEEPLLDQALVGVVRMEDHAYAIGETGADGSVTFRGLPRGTYLVNASRKGWLPAGEERVPLANDRKWELYLDEAVMTTVRVVDDGGHPVAGAELWTANLDEEFEQEVSKRVGKTNSNGEFKFPFDWDGKNCALHIAKEGYGMAMAYPDDPSEGGVLEVRLAPGVRLRGKVTDIAGRPIEGAMVYIEITPEDLDEDDVYATIYTDAKGAYRFPYLPPGDVWVEVTMDGFEGDDHDLEVRPGRRGEIVKDFMLEKE